VEQQHGGKGNQAFGHPKKDFWHVLQKICTTVSLLLGIAQTCRFQGKSFLKFLLSKEKDVNLFKASRSFKHSVPVTPESRRGCPEAS
jgi:G:T/U-mismatch repair DNA glycosylase